MSSSEENLRYGDTKIGYPPGTWASFEHDSKHITKSFSNPQQLISRSGTESGDDKIVDERVIHSEKKIISLQNAKALAGHIVAARHLRRPAEPISSLVPENLTSNISSFLKSSSLEAIDGSSESAEKGLVASIRQEWRKSQYYKGTTSRSPSVCPGSVLLEYKKTRNHNYKPYVTNMISDMSDEDESYYGLRESIKSMFPPGQPGMKDIDNGADRNGVPLTQLGDIRNIADPSVLKWRERFIYEGANLGHPTPQRHLRWLCALWEAFDRCRLQRFACTEIHDPRATISMVRKNILFDPRTLEIFGLIILKNKDHMENDTPSRSGLGVFAPNIEDVERC